jgi:hypothetical protein
MEASSFLLAARPDRATTSLLPTILLQSARELRIANVSRSENSTGNYHSAAHLRRIVHG